MSSTRRLQLALALRAAPLLAAILVAACTKQQAVSSRPTIFADVTRAAGVDFTHFTGATGHYYIPEIMGSGCALFDYDGDQDLDLYAVQGAPLGDGPSPALAPANRLFRNETIRGEAGGKGTTRGSLQFTDVTDEARVGNTGYGMGAAVGDYDGDQDLDLYVTNFGPNVLYRNEANGTFTDVTEPSGVGDPAFSSSAAWLDYDRDGRLDLFVVNYVKFSLATNRHCIRLGGQVDYCGPVSYEPAPNRLYHNEGEGRFSDATARSGIASKVGNGLAVVCADLNDDGWVDIFVANDATPNFLWFNRHDGTFEERALASGCAVSADGLSLAGMGIAAGDFDRDLNLDLYVTHEVAEVNTLYSSLGAGTFEDMTSRVGLATPSLPFSGFGTFFFDYDADGWLDLLVANGAVRRIAAQTGDPRPYKQPAQLFKNDHGRFIDVTPEAGLDMDGIQSSRGAACGDMDLDGDLDVVLTANGGSLRVLRNDAQAAGRTVRVRLRGLRSSASVLGARVELKLTDGTLLLRVAGAMGSYLSAGPESVHFGVPKGLEPLECTVRWPLSTSRHYVWPSGKAEIVCDELSPAAPGPGSSIEELLPRVPRTELAAGAHFIGSTKCAECHPEHVDKQRTHHMFLTGQRVAPATGGWPSAEELKKPVSWPEGSLTAAPKITVAANGLRFHGQDANGKTAAALATVVFGSGSHARTPLSSEKGGSIRELKLSFSPGSGSWIQTPGAREDPDPIGTPSTPERSRWCLSCHSSVLAWQDGTLDADRSVFGIHCERCHGPGSVHAANLSKGSGGMAILYPGSLSPAESVQLCGECHRTPSDLDSADVLKRDRSIARHAGATLMLSACYRRSPPEKTITCVECHNPHQNLDRTRDDYRRPCLRCHTEPEKHHKSKPLEPGASCVGCHMPLERQSLGDFSFTDHWIRVPGSPAPLQSPAQAEIMGSLESSYREAIASGGRGPEHLATLYGRLGDLLCSSGRISAGVEAFQAALKLAPPYSEQVRLAEKLDRAGKTVEAIEALHVAQRAEPKFNRAYHALVRIHLREGSFERAAAALAAWRQHIPGDPALLETSQDFERARTGEAARNREREQ